MQFIHFFDLREKLVLIRTKQLFCSVITILCFTCFVGNMDAQEIKTNTSGDMIVVFSDGSWRYFDDKSQSDLELLKAQNLKEENAGSIFDPAPKKKSKKNKEKSSKKVKTKKPKKSKKTKLAKKKSNKTKKEKYAKGSKKKNKKKSKTPKYSASVEAEARKEAMLRSERLLAKESSAQVRLEEAEFNRIFAEEEVKEAYENPDKTNDDIEILEKRLIRAKADESSAKEEYKIAKREAAQSVKMIDMDKAKRDKMLAKINGESSNATAANGKRSKKSKKKIGFKKGKDKQSGILNTTDSTVANSNKGFKKYSRSEDVMLNPPPTPCSYAYDGFDEFSGKHRKELEKQVFFTFTNDRLKPIFREKDHIVCVASLSSIAGVSMLHVEITIASEMAQREFGALDKGSYLSIKLIDGTAVQLINNKTDIGFLDKFSRSVKYKGRYLLSKDDEKALMKSEVDKVRVVWGTGFEDYEIYEMDFFRDQLSCLKGK